jgi:copper(I)-binding protein
MKRVLTLLPLAALVLAACGSDDDPITVDGAWARTSPASSTLGAVYLEVTADPADTLLGVSVPSSVADHAEIHEVVPAGDAMSGDEMSSEMSGDEMSGEMSGDEMSSDSGTDMGDGEMAMVMQEMPDGLALPAGETVTLEPGSYHIMLIDLVAPLENGDEFDVTLDFENADDMTITVEVADTAPE